MIYLKNLKFTGQLMFRGPGGAPVVIPEPEECVISLRSHFTNSVYAKHTPTALTSTQRGGPGTSWYVQVARWTTPYSTNINEYAIEPGPIELYLDGKLLPFDGITDYQTSIGELVQVISSVTGWIAYLDYLQDSETGEFSDEVLVVAYTAGAPKRGLEIAYPQDSMGQTQPHPAVELLYNGAWRHGAPVDAECKPLAPADYAQVKWTFPGGIYYDETGGMGAFGETSSTTTTRNTVFPAGRTYPSLTSIAGSLTEESPITALGLDSVTNKRFEISINVGDSFQNASYSVYDDTATIADFIAQMNYYSGLLVGLSDGHLVFLATTADVALEQAFDLTGPGASIVFGEQTPVISHAWVFNQSVNQFELNTPLAQFSPKGMMEYAVYAGYPSDFVTIGFVSGKGTPYAGGQQPLETIADLIAAVNTASGGNIARAYLENGRLVVAIIDITNEPTATLASRYVDAELVNGEARDFGEAAELMLGASDRRNGRAYLYNDQIANNGLSNSYSLSIFGDTIPARSVLPANVDYDDVVLGTRTISVTDKLSKFYPVGYILQPYSTYFNNTYQGTAIEVSTENTVQDALNYFGVVVGTFRLVDGNGIHQDTIGFLRMTGTYASVIWYDPATKNYGEATRLFVDGLDDGSAPTNVTGQR